MHCDMPDGDHWMILSTYLQSEANTSRSDTAGSAPAAIWKPGNYDSTTDLSAPQESSLYDAEDGESLCIVEDRLWDGVKGRVWVVWIGEEALEDLCSPLALFGQ